MRQTLLFTGLETIVRNINNRNQNLQLFEFGKTHLLNPNTNKGDDVTLRFREQDKIAIFLTGKRIEESWNQAGVDVDFFYLKNVIKSILLKIHFPIQDITFKTTTSNQFLENLLYEYNGTPIAQFGQLHPRILKNFDLKKPVFFAELDFRSLFLNSQNRPIHYTRIPTYPTVKRDLALIIDKAVPYSTLEEIAYKYGTSKLKKVTLFDVYEGEKLEAGKRSYALNFILQNDEKTLTDDEINKIMNKLIAAFERECGATLR